MEIGAQLFTVRETTKTAKQFEQSMKKISDIGYRCVQISAIGDISAEKVRTICDKYDLKIIVTHTNQQKILEQTDQVIQDHKVMGAQYVGIGSMPEQYRVGLGGIQQFIQDYKPVAEKIQESGLQLVYHNHAFELEKYDGKTGLEYIAEGFGKELLGFILDLYWIQYGGGDPANWIKKLSGMVPMVHLKDLQIVKDEQRMAEVMEGNLNWKRIFKACKKNHVAWAFVEQDNCYEKNPFDCLATSFENLKLI